MNYSKKLFRMLLCNDNMQNELFQEYKCQCEAQI
jgi:hypothetical protein